MSAANKLQIIFEVLKSEANDVSLAYKKHPLTDKTKIESKSWAQIKYDVMLSDQTFIGNGLWVKIKKDAMGDDYHSKPWFVSFLI